MPARRDDDDDDGKHHAVTSSVTSDPARRRARIPSHERWESSVGPLVPNNILFADDAAAPTTNTDVTLAERRRRAPERVESFAALSPFTRGWKRGGEYDGALS